MLQVDSYALLSQVAVSALPLRKLPTLSAGVHWLRHPHPARTLIRPYVVRCWLPTIVVLLYQTRRCTTYSACSRPDTAIWSCYASPAASLCGRRCADIILS